MQGAVDVFVMSVVRRQKFGKVVFGLGRFHRNARPECAADPV